MESAQLSRDKSKTFKREGLAQLKLFIKSRSGKRDLTEYSSSTTSSPSPSVRTTEEISSEISHGPSSFRKKLVEIEEEHSWTLIHARGDKPPARFHHGAAVVGRKLLVIGGETGSQMLNDVQMFHLGKLSWSTIGVGASAPSEGLPRKTGPAEQLPNCKGHSLISWGKTVILIGGQMEPQEDRVSVWSFDLEMDCWTKVVTKGEIPSARSGQSVTRAGSILIMFGGEDQKGRKLNDLHILDLKSLMWLPLHTTGGGPSPRTRHVAEMYDDRFLLVFGGATRSKISSDIYALDFDSMEWSRLKTKGLPPTPRAGHAGTLVGDKWYIVGGESRVPGALETSVLNISSMNWSVVAPATPDFVASHQGLSVVFVQRKAKKFLVAFGGRGIEASNLVQVLYIRPEEEQEVPKTLAGLLGVPTTPEASLVSTPESHQNRQQISYPSLMGSHLPCACVHVAKSNLVSVIDHRSGRKSVSESSLDGKDSDHTSGLIPLRKRYAMNPDSRESSFSRSRQRDLAKLRDPTRLDWPEGKERLQQRAEMVRGDLQSTAPSVDSGLLSAEDLQMSASSVRPSSSLGDAGAMLCHNYAVNSRKTRSRKGSFQSSEFPEYSETSISGLREEQQHTCDQSIAASSSSVDSNLSWMSGGSQSPTSISNRTTPEYEEDELTVLAKLHKADTPEERMTEISRLRRHHERKLAASIRKGEIIAGQLAEALRNKDEAERTLQTVLRSRQKTEARLAAALKEQKDLQDALATTDRARQESSNTVHKTKVHNLKLEHDLALLKAVLEDTQKELHSTRGVLIGERTRAFQLQVELFDVKQKLHSLDPGQVTLPRMQQAILA